MMQYHSALSRGDLKGYLPSARQNFRNQGGQNFRNRQQLTLAALESWFERHLADARWRRFQDINKPTSGLADGISFIGGTHLFV
jgi:hypothetical protein